MALRKSAQHEYLSEITFNLSEMDSVDLFGDRARLLPQKDKFLGLFNREELEDALNQSGLLPGLVKKGFTDFTIDIQTEIESDHRLIITDNESSEQLIFMRLHLGAYSASELFAPLERMRLLFIDWLLLQNPKAKASRKPLFPGQKFPGNGLFPEVKKFMLMLIERGKLDGAANLPEFFHDAVLFADKFQFLNPESQGIFEALLRDLGKIGLRKLSSCIHDNLVLQKESGKEAEMFNFKPGEMVVGNSTELKVYLSSPKYRQIANKTRDKFSFSLVKDS
ncbi:MAG: hypothetical protein KDK41_07495 [Leptospiraceae bacterium]|nr:hypothetical protein [Leptospiraceae bacterium]MCB1200474.1 hypothetical protein [Leptospiraceae bacterium]